MDANKKRLIVKSTSSGGRISNLEESRLKPEGSRILGLKEKIKNAEREGRRFKDINSKILAVLKKRESEGKKTGIVFPRFKPKKPVRRL